MKISKMKFDKARESGGVWCDFDVHPDPAKICRVKIARIHTPQYDDTMRKLSKPYQKLILDGSIPTEVLNEIQCRAAAQCLVKDWVNVEDDNGNPVPFSKENAYEIMSSAQQFFKTVMDFAAQNELFRLDVVEEAQGNS